MLYLRSRLDFIGSDHFEPECGRGLNLGRVRNAGLLLGLSRRLLGRLGGGGCEHDDGAVDGGFEVEEAAHGNRGKRSHCG